MKRIHCRWLNSQIRTHILKDFCMRLSDHTPVYHGYKPFYHPFILLNSGWLSPHGAQDIISSEIKNGIDIALSSFMSEVAIKQPVSGCRTKLADPTSFLNGLGRSCLSQLRYIVGCRVISFLIPNTCHNFRWVFSKKRNSLKILGCVMDAVVESRWKRKRNPRIILSSSFWCASNLYFPSLYSQLFASLLRWRSTWVAGAAGLTRVFAAMPRRNIYDDLNTRR